MRRINLIIICLIFFVSACNQEEKQANKITLTTIGADTVIQDKEKVQDDINLENIEEVPIFPQYDYNRNIFPSEILISGLLHGNEVPKNAKSQIWYGLFESKEGKCKIQKTELTLEKTLDPIVDDEGDKPTGVFVDVRNADDLVILLCKIELQENQEIHSINNHPTEILPDEDFKFTFEGIEYKLVAKGIKKRYKNSEKWYAQRNYQLYLEAEIKGKKMETLISSYPYLDDSMIEILFIGDIDSDGKIDLIIDNSYKYNSFTPTVYLSSMAENEQLLKVIAMKKFLGC